MLASFVAFTLAKLGQLEHQNNSNSILFCIESTKKPWVQTDINKGINRLRVWLGMTYLYRYKYCPIKDILTIKE